MDKIDFASLLSSRICHDLISPVSALANGIEILSEEDDKEIFDQALELLTHSVREASGRLQLYRIAFGGSASLGDAIEVGQAKNALGAYLSSHRIALEWRAGVDRLDKRAVKLLMNLALIGAESLVRGGAIEIDAAIRDDRVFLGVSASGERMILVDGLQAALEGNAAPEAIDARCAPAALASAIAKDLDGEIAIEIDPAGALSLVASIPRSAAVS